MPVKHEKQAALGENEIYREVVTIRKTTETRPAIRFVITQKIDPLSGDVALASFDLEGELPAHIESPGFLMDLGKGYIYSGMVVELRNKRVNGVKR